jgi:hypothetical protein
MPAPAKPFRLRTSNELSGSSTGSVEQPDSAPRQTLNVSINGRDHSIPMNEAFGEHRSLHGAAELVRGSGGLDAKLVPATWSTVSVRLTAAAEPLRVQRRISALAGDLLQMGIDASANGVPPGCIPGFRLRERGGPRLDADIYIEKSDATGPLDLEHLCLETAAHAVALPLARLAECHSPPTIRVISTRVEQVRVTCRVDVSDLVEACARGTEAPNAAAPFGPSRIHELMRCFGADSHLPHLTAEHNEHLLGAASAAALVLGLDPRRLELDARAYATRWGSCEPLAKWRQRDRELLGQLQIPLEVGSDETSDVREPAPNAQTASERLLQVASVGLIASLSFLCRGLFARPQHQRPRMLLPPPLLIPTRDHQRKHPASERAASESGVHPAIGSASDTWSQTG